MTTNFETTERIIAVPANAVNALFPDLLAQYGQPLHDGPRMIVTIGGFYGDSARTVIGAASLVDGTITGQPLTDGRIAFRCLWQADLAAAFDAGEIEGVEELDEAELAALTAQPETE
jgi:hypothetical protein